MTDLYVSPSGSSSAAGTLTDPIDINTAMTRQRVRNEGDRILLGGTYSGTFTQTVNGQAVSQPLVYRSAPGQLAIIDGGLTVNGNDVIFKQLLVKNTSTDRTIERPTGIALVGTRSSARHCVLMDVGVAIQTEAGNATGEIYGCITVNQGWELDATDRGHGHSVYLQNGTGSAKKVRHNIFGPGYGWNIHCYSATQDLKDVQWEANAAAFGGLLAGETSSGGFSAVRYGSIIGGGGASARHTITRHYGAEGTWDLSYLAGGFDTLTMSGVIRGTSGEGDWTSLTDTSTHPSADAVYVETDEYETGRANVIVYNSALTSTVAVDPSSVLTVGDTFGIFDGFNPLGIPLVTGVYAGGTVAVTMPTAFAVPVGGWRWGSAPARSKAFGVFVVRKMTSWVAPA